MALTQHGLDLGEFRGEQLIGRHAVSLRESFEHRKVEVHWRRKKHSHRFKVTNVRFVFRIFFFLQNLMSGVVPFWQRCQLILRQIKLIRPVLLELSSDILDPPPTSTKPCHVKIKKCDVRNLEATEESPKVVDMTPA
ncbi:hypothetical protein D3C84_801530 [compost metagenome]